MIFILSPAKTLDFSPATAQLQKSAPRFIDKANKLASEVGRLSQEELKKLMNISDALAELNFNRFQNWDDSPTEEKTKQALYAFKGDVYTGIDVETLSNEAQEYLHSNLRILSGLYGLLSPLDVILPYRLEMGSKFDNSAGKNLYEYWGTVIAESLADDVSKNGGVLINLASNEYFKSVKPKSLTNTRIITPVFKDEKGGTFKVVSFFAKKARGLMCRFAAEHAITDPEQLKTFDSEGYFYNPDLSSGDEWVFTRLSK